MAIMESVSQQQQDGKTNNNSHQNSHQINLNPEPIDFEECLKDSPKFRQTLKDNLTFAEGLETLMSKAIKQVGDYIDTGREHIRSQKDFIGSMRNLNSALSQKESGVSKRVNTLLETLEEIMHLHEIVIDQSCRTVGSRLNNFIADDLLKIREARKSFDKISHEYDQAVSKHSQPLKKQQDDSENILIATSTAFAHTSLDLSIQLTSLQSKKGYEILDSLLSFTKAHSTFFHQGYDLFEDLKPHISDMDEYLSNIQDEFETLNRSLPSKHLMVSNNELRPIHFDNKAQNVRLEGYLFKRASNGFKVWNRRWFILRDHQLLYQKRGDTQPIIMEEDLRLLTVRPIDKVDNDRRYCFEVLSPHKSHILQADSEACCKTWISAIQAGINAAFHDTEHKFTTSLMSSKPNCTGSTSTVSTNSSTVNAGSWSTGFSFKTLHQHATYKLSSMTASGDSSGKESTSNENNMKNSERVTGSEDDDELNEDGFKTDEQGRSYAPLREDDVDEDQVDSVKSRSKASTTYPAAARADLNLVLEKAPEPPTKPQRAYMKILAMPGNDECADCGAPQPKWASINLGITLCIECAGIHRSLGVHLSKVRSLTLDTEVWSPEIVQLMLSLGNKSVNAAYLSCLRGQAAVPINPDSSREDRETWIKNKYISKLFMQPPEFKSSVNTNETSKKVQEEPITKCHSDSEKTDQDQNPSKCSSSGTI